MTKLRVLLDNLYGDRPEGVKKWLLLVGTRFVNQRLVKGLGFDS